MKAWTNEFFHLRITVTSHVEGTHSVLKASLQVLTEDLYRIQTTITLMVTNQKKKINSIVASDCI